MLYPNYQTGRSIYNIANQAQYSYDRIAEEKRQEQARKDMQEYAKIAMKNYQAMRERNEKTAKNVRNGEL
jgi:Flp pilus assembly protein TadG